MGRRRSGRHPYDYTAGDDVRFADSGVGATLRVLHGPSRGMGVPLGVQCRVEVQSSDGSPLDESHAGTFGKEHRLHGTSRGDRIAVTVEAGFGNLETSETRVFVLTGDLGDVVRFGVGPAWDVVVAIDTHNEETGDLAPAADRWGAGVRLRGARPGAADGSARLNVSTAEVVEAIHAERPD